MNETRIRSSFPKRKSATNEDELQAMRVRAFGDGADDENAVAVIPLSKIWNDFDKQHIINCFYKYVLEKERPK
tara:strand:- start:1215 stop:1433 length:219 start_codon:yes stop_codon:yes gene_type:complete